MIKDVWNSGLSVKKLNWPRLGIESINFKTEFGPFQLASYGRMQFWVLGFHANPDFIIFQ